MPFSHYNHSIEDTIDPTTNPAYNTVTHTVYDEIIPSPDGSFSHYNHSTEDTIDPTTNPAVTQTVYDEIIPSELHSDGYVKFIFPESCMHGLYIIIILAWTSLVNQMLHIIQ